MKVLTDPGGPRSIKARISSYIIYVSMIGIINDKECDLSDPESKPIYKLYFDKNRYGTVGRTLWFDPSNPTFYVPSVTKNDIEAVKIAINEFHKGSEIVYIQ